MIQSFGLEAKDAHKRLVFYSGNSCEEIRSLAVWAEDGLLTIAAHELSSI